MGSFYVGNNMEWPHLMEQALRAHLVYEQDKDYVVEQGDERRSHATSCIVDEYTGRKMAGRQWSDGLHQAVEAKEQVPIKQETQTLATITLQNFFKLYKALSGMTGTAQTEAEEFNKIYKLDVVTIPTNRPDRPRRTTKTASTAPRRRSGRRSSTRSRKRATRAGRCWSARPASKRARCSRRC